MFFMFTGQNFCSTKNGGCQHLCLPKGKIVTCQCSDGYILDSDNKTCTGKYSCRFLESKITKKCKVHVDDNFLTCYYLRVNMYRNC